MTKRARQKATRNTRPASVRADRPGPRLQVRAKLWIDLGGSAGMTEDAADLLEQIEVCGSLSEAARRLKFSYRRAWMLADAVNRRWPEPLMVRTTGGRRGGGAQLTDFGRSVVRVYRDLQIQLEHFLGQASTAFEAATGV